MSVFFTVFITILEKACYCAKSWAIHWSYSGFEPEMGCISGKAKQEGAKIASFQLRSFLFGVPITSWPPRNVPYLSELLPSAYPFLW